MPSLLTEIHPLNLSLPTIYRYMGDPEVDVFLREFGRVMSSHFETLGAQQHNSSSGSGSISGAQQPRKIVEEVGPLQAEALRKAKQGDSVDDSRVREVLDDPELSELLMDPHMQQVLQVSQPPNIHTCCLRTAWYVSIQQTLTLT